MHILLGLHKVCRAAHTGTTKEASKPMMKRTVAALLTICMGIAIGVLLAVAGRSGTAVAAPPSPASSASPAPSQSPAYSSPARSRPAPNIGLEEGSSTAVGPGYYIRDYKGRVAVVPSGQAEPEMIFDIQTKMLPELDRQQLADGIYVATYEELIRLVEDYIS